MGTLCVVLHSHLPWLLGHGALAGRRGVAAPGLDAAAGCRVTDVLRRARRRGAARPADPRRHPGARGPARPPRRPARGARPGRRAGRCAPQESAARSGAARWRDAGRPRVPRGRVDGGAAGRDRGAPAVSPVLRRPRRPRGGRAARRSRHPPLPARCSTTRVGRARAATPGCEDARVAVRSRRRSGSWSPECGHRRRPGAGARPGSASGTPCTTRRRCTRRAARSVPLAWRMAGHPSSRRLATCSVTDLVWSSRLGVPDPPRRTATSTPSTPRSGLRPYAAAGPRVDTEALVQARSSPRSRCSATRRRSSLRCDDRLVDASGPSVGEYGLVVVAWDTELFGHWWHEGPAFLEAVLRALPAAGVRGGVAGHGAARAGRRGRRRGRPRRRVVGRGQGLLGLVRPGGARPWPRRGSGCSVGCSTCWRASAPPAGSPTGGVPTWTSSCGRLCSCCRATGRSW